MYDHTRESLAKYGDYSILSEQVIEVLNQAINRRGKAKQIRGDNDLEFTCESFMRWGNKNEIIIKHIQPGKPAQNVYIERLNKTYKEDVLNACQFDCIKEQRIPSDEWQYYYNQYHPHKELKRQPPHCLPSLPAKSHVKGMIEQQQQNYSKQ